MRNSYGQHFPGIEAEGVNALNQFFGTKWQANGHAIPQENLRQ